MTHPTHVHVKAPEGRLTPVHKDDGTEIDGGQLLVKHGEVRRVRWSQTTLRSWGRGDLILCDMNGNAVQSAELAAAPDELPDGLNRKACAPAAPAPGVKS